VAILDREDPGFEYEGEMAPDAALNPKVMALYPFSRLSGPANVLIMPGLQSANLSAKLLRELGSNATIGPMLIGMEKPVQIVPMTALRARCADAGGAGGPAARPARPPAACWR
jgi:malate dehydrogenase (oxaloacetate-decarboxylating)(NADP+)